MEERIAAVPYGPAMTGDAVTHAARIAAGTGLERHDVAVVLGSGWRPAADRMGETVARMPATSLGLPAGGVPGHVDEVRSLRTPRGHAVLAFLGRVHPYEGQDLSVVVAGVRAACAAGCSTVVLTNASGALRGDLAVGQPVLVSDHLNLTGRSPLVGPRFVDLTDLYNARLRRLARHARPDLAEGVYAAMPGPQYETPAEIRMLRTLGADLVGMSTVHEAIAGRAEGAEVLALSLVTNVAAGLGGPALDHADVLAAGAAASEQMGTLLTDVIDAITA